MNVTLAPCGRTMMLRCLEGAKTRSNLHSVVERLEIQTTRTVRANRPALALLTV